MSWMELPARLGKYELVEFLGGGMSQVYRAKEMGSGRVVAVKVLTKEGCTDPEIRARFLQEARMTGSFAHENIIRVFECGEENGTPYLVMEFLRGETLREAIGNRHTGDAQSKLHIAAQVARALDYIHSLKVIHRDIKPDNLHIDANGRVKLMDFGIAKERNVALTRMGFTLGTPYYMAPEQVMGHPATPLVDIYSFGIVLFELFTGEKPVKAETIEKVFEKILNEAINYEPLRRPDVPQEVVELVRRCTARRVQQRMQTFGAVAAELEGIMGKVPGLPPPADSLPGFLRKLPPSMQSQQWFIAIVAIGVIFGMLTVGIVLRTVSRILD